MPIDLGEDPPPKVVSVSCGNFYTFLIVEDELGSRTLRSFGRNHKAQLGIANALLPEPTFTIRTPSITLTNPSDSSEPQFVVCSKGNLDANGSASTLVVMGDGKVYGCGSNSCGQLSTGDLNDQSSFTRGSTVAAGQVTHVALGSESTLLVVKGVDGKQTLYLGGQDATSEITRRSTPVKQGTLTDLAEAGDEIVALSASARSQFVLFASGLLYRLGYNGNGELGVNDTANRPAFMHWPESPLHLSATHCDRVVSGFNHTFALASGYTPRGANLLFGHGWNANRGALGVGDLESNTKFPRPMAIPDFQDSKMPGLLYKNVTQVATYAEHTLVLLSDNTLYGCGKNTEQQLGVDGTRLSPVPLIVVP
jgi:alpha-tubulin suppressor-like RCC1 family protein